ncbi:MAG: ATP-binding protein [Nitrospinota bacterium]|nr:ATP-binding protein [Nitrospinota bacterium]
MTSGENHESREKNSREVIKALIIFRIIVISFFLGLLIIFQIQFGNLPFSFPLSMIAAATYFLSIIYIYLSKKISRVSAFLYTQLFIDLTMETAIIFFAGGVDSPFTFLYMFTIIAASIVLERPSSFVMSSTASILYGLLVNFEFYGLIHPLPLLAGEGKGATGGYIFFTVFAHIAAFNMVAYLSDFLSQRFRNIFIEYISKSRDLTELKAFHENVIAHMGSGFLALNMNKKIISLNQASCKILAKRENLIIGTQLEEVFPNIKPDLFSLSALQESKDNTASFETVYTDQNGKDIILTFTVSPFYNPSGKSIGYIMIFQDVTKIKHMEQTIERSERLASMGRIAAGLAHEIRNPLGSISGSIQMLKKNNITSGKDDSSQTLMSIILRETERLNHIIDNFLSASTTIAKTVENVNLSEIVGESLLLFRNDKSYSDRIKIKTDIDETITIQGNFESLKQVIWNLLLNSAQAIDKEGTIDISAKPNAEKGNSVTLFFSDTGCGIDKESLTKIFEPFYTTKTKGTGLGLSTALKILEAHNATINLTSRKNEGTNFQITFPAQ